MSGLGPARGYLCLVLHAHLPYVRHPEHERFLEEGWFYEGMLETYIPLAEMLDRLAAEGVAWRLTLSLSPTLTAMMQDTLLVQRLLRHLDGLIDLAGKEARRTGGEPARHGLARFYLDRFRRLRRSFRDEYGCDLPAAFRRHAEAGRLELITCAATHGLLPLLKHVPGVVDAQVGLAVAAHARLFGNPPRGMWIPECAFYPGLDEVLARHGLRFFFVDGHALAHAGAPPRGGTWAPLLCPAGPAAFARDEECSRQVWSAKEGYPGDPDYRDFYRDVGFDLEWDYVRPYLFSREVRGATGIKYYRITGATDRKELYRPEWALARAEIHAGNFLFNRERQVEGLQDRVPGPPVVVAPYDAELFGHWWFEGLDFLEAFFRKCAARPRVFRLATPAEYLELHPVQQVAMPAASTWGWRGGNEMWVNETNDWIYPRLDRLAEELGARLAAADPRCRPLLRRALAQAGRELLLAQASDWAFIMKSGTAVGYAEMRTREHLRAGHALLRGVRRGRIDGRLLAALEGRDGLFPDLDPWVFLAGGERPARRRARRARAGE